LQRLVDAAEKFPNKDETKFHILPDPEVPEVESIRRFFQESAKWFNGSCSVVSLGVGHDTVAEKRLRKALPASCLFYGADPIPVRARAFKRRGDLRFRK